MIQLCHLVKVTFTSLVKSVVTNSTQRPCCFKWPTVCWPIMIIIIIMIAFKGAFRDFLQSPHCATNCLQYVHSSGHGAIMCKLCATHQAIITRNTLCATWYEETAQLFSLTEFKSHLFELYFIGRTINWPHKISVVTSDKPHHQKHKWKANTRTGHLEMIHSSCLFLFAIVYKDLTIFNWFFSTFFVMCSKHGLNIKFRPSQTKANNNKNKRWFIFR